MRRSRLYSLLGLALALAWAPGAVARAAGRSGPLPWGELTLIPAAPEAPALGPDLLAVAEDGRVALWNPAEALVRVLPGVDAALAGDPGEAFALAAADDLAWTGAGLLVLDGRRLRLYDARGQLLSDRELPGLVPVGVRLAPAGDLIYGADVFSNRHPLARIEGARLLAPPDGALLPPETRVRWDAGARTITAGNTRIALTDALKAGGRVLSGGGRRWLVLDVVVGDAPLVVERRARCLETGAEARLPVAGRLYAPSADLAVDGRGRLVWMAPFADGLWLGEVAP